MPHAKFGDKTPLDSGSTKIFKLTSKGQKATIRILNDGFYNGKHFIQRGDGSWTVFYCPRVMLEKPCMYCKKYFEKKKELKKLEKAKSKDSEAMKLLAKDIRRFGSTIRWYYPALNRDAGTPIILQVTLGVRNKLEGFVEAGIDVLASDFILMRTEKPGSDYYSLIRKDSKNTPELTKDEVVGCTEALSWDIEKEVQGKESSLTFVPENEKSNSKT